MFKKKTVQNQYTSAFTRFQTLTGVRYTNQQPNHFNAYLQIANKCSLTPNFVKNVKIFLEWVGFAPQTPHLFFSFSCLFLRFFQKKTPFPPTCAILAPLPMIFGTWRSSVNILIYVTVSHIFFFISMSFSTVSPLKTPFPPICAHLASLPRTSGTGR